jgi:hypothetical protein
MNAVDRLIVERASQTMTSGGFAASLNILANDQQRHQHFSDARKWVKAAIDLVKQAPGGESFGNDDAIAQRILDQITERRKARHA